MSCINIIANNLALSNTIEQKNLSCAEQIALMFKDAKGYAAVFRKDAEDENKRSYYIPASVLDTRIQSLVEKLHGHNVYVSQNTFYKYKSRCVDDLYELRHLYVDIDCHKLAFTADQTLMHLEKEFFRRSIPEPTFIIFSGRGLQLIWQIQAESAYSLPMWQSVEDYLCEVLRPLGGDPAATDASRVLRVAESINTKNNALVSVEHRYKEQYTLTEIIEGYILPFLPEPVKPSSKPRKKSSNFNKVKRLLSPYSLAHSRMLDIRKLIELRANCSPSEGRSWGRETLLFLYRYYSCVFDKDTEKALEKTLELNRLFAKPLSEKEVHRATQSAEKMFNKLDNEAEIQKAKELGFPTIGYNYKNSSLINLLEITLDEQKHLKTIISADEKERRRTEKRHSVGRSDRRKGQAPSLTRKEYIAECNNAVSDKVSNAKEMRAQGMSQRAIAKELDVSVSTVNGYLKK